MDCNTQSNLSTFSGVLRWTMSMSNVVAGAPRTTAESMPTRIAYTPSDARRRKASTSLANALSLVQESTQVGDPVEPVLQQSQTLDRGELEHPFDLRTIHTGASRSHPTFR